LVEHSLCPAIKFFHIPSRTKRKKKEEEEDEFIIIIVFHNSNFRFFRLFFIKTTKPISSNTPNISNQSPKRGFLLMLLHSQARNPIQRKLANEIIIRNTPSNVKVSKGGSMGGKREQGE
jgi:hypothetical protein